MRNVTPNQGIDTYRRVVYDMYASSPVALKWLDDEIEGASRVNLGVTRLGGCLTCTTMQSFGRIILSVPAYRHGILARHPCNSMTITLSCLWVTWYLP